MMDSDKLSLARFMAREMIKQRDIINGGFLLMGKESMDDRELIATARCALQLIESGAVK